MKVGAEGTIWYLFSKNILLFYLHEVLSFDFPGRQSEQSLGSKSVVTYYSVQEAQALNRCISQPLRFCTEFWNFRVGNLELGN